MKDSEELNYCKSVISQNGRDKTLSILKLSNLTDREIEIIIYRLIKGKSLKECADHFLLTKDSINKAQKKACVKLFDWLHANQTIITKSS